MSKDRSISLKTENKLIGHNVYLSQKKPKVLISSDILFLEDGWIKVTDSRGIPHRINKDYVMNIEEKDNFVKIVYDNVATVQGKLIAIEDKNFLIEVDNRKDGFKYQYFIHINSLYGTKIFTDEGEVDLEED